MTATVIRMAIGEGGRVALVVSVNPFSNIKHPAAGRARACYQVYDTTAETGRLALVSEQTYNGDRCEIEACEKFAEMHPAKAVQS